MRTLMKYTYLMNPEKVSEELDNLWNRYQEIIDQESPTWENVNEARSILYLTGRIYCEKIAVEAIERRLHLLEEELTLLEFLDLIDKGSERLEELRRDEMFDKLERFYRIVKRYKMKYIEGKYYLEEEKFLKIYEKVNPDKDIKVGWRGSFEK